MNKGDFMNSGLIKSLRKPSRYIFLISGFVFFVFYSLFVVGGGMVELELIPILVSILNMLIMTVPLILMAIFYILEKEKIYKVLFTVFGAYFFIDTILRKLKGAMNLVGGNNGAFATGLFLNFIAGIIGIVVVVFLAVNWITKKNVFYKIGIILGGVFVGLSFVTGIITVIGYAVDMYPWYEIMGEIAYSIALPIFLLTGIATIFVPLVEGEEALPPLIKKTSFGAFFTVIGVLIGSTYITVSAVGLSVYRISPYGKNAAAERMDPVDYSSDTTFYYSNLSQSSGSSSYTETISKVSTFKTYHLKNKGDIPYVSFTEAYSSIYTSFFINSSYATQFALAITANEDATYTLKNDYGSLDVDVFKDSISTSDFDPLISMYNRNDDGIDIDLINGVETDNCTVKSTSRTVVERKKDFKFSLRKYNLDLLAFDEVIYIPLQTFNDIFIISNGVSIAYNGKDLFYTGCFYNRGASAPSSSLEYKYYNESPWKDRSTRESTLANYTYNEMYFYLDTFYGLKEHRGIGSFDSWITSLGLKNKLLSTDSKTYDEAFVTFICKYLGEGHTSYRQHSPFGASRDYSKLVEDMNKENKRVAKLNSDYETYSKMRKQAEKTVGVTFSENGKTAIIRFDQFAKLSNTSGIDVTKYSYEILEEADSYLFFQKAFGEITNKTSVRYVVIDITNNGGGAFAAMPYLLAYMTDNPKVASRNRLTGEVTELSLSVDLDRNGTFGDNYANKYKFFVMMSGYSFSCGNGFPTYVRDYKLATLIGEKSGGGSCVVSQLVTACGSMSRMSGTNQLGSVSGNNFYDNDDGINPDRYFGSENWYDDEKIDDFVRGL